MYKIDLHTHSIASGDGSIQPDQYQQKLENGTLDCIAVTDHNRIDMAVELQKVHGEKIIVGEEITTTEGEIIGLYLKTVVEPYQSALDTVKAIKKQGGIVYIPHPFETVRKGLTTATMDALVDYIDIVEVHNGRAVFQNRSHKALIWTTMNHKAWAASSDAHGAKGLAQTYTILSDLPTRDTLTDLVAKGQAIVARPPLKTLLYPKVNRLRKKIKRKKA